jgi:two-component system sensor histidine kinase/response regulator
MEINNMIQTILVVDDTPDNLRLLVGMLTDKGYKVRPAPNGARALATVQKELPDLILLDIMMPEMDGYEVCRQLKADERTRDVPVIFISALDEVFDKITAFSIGGIDYITKPFQLEEVLARVRTHLDLQDMRRKLQKQNEQLQQQNAELDAFAHTVAHDLKNPLGLIVGYTQILYQDAPNLSSQDLESIGYESYRAAKKSANIIDSLLLLASVRKEDVEMASLDMADIVKQALERLELMIEEYQGEIVLPETWPVVLGYAPWIEAVWVNYLSNGLKYGGQPPRLELGATPQSDGTVQFWVKDNGPDLKADEQTALFTEFTRLNKVRLEGHGLGLSIVRRIINKLGGQVGVESEGSQGSRFFFILRMNEEDG